MATKSERRPRHTTMMPVTTMEEVPVLTHAEREALVESLEEGEKRISAGEFVDYDPLTLKARLLNLHRKNKV